MSLTITQQPLTDLQSANNDSFYVVSGTTYNAPNVSEYKYVADVYVNTVLSATLKSFPDPTFGFGVFNLRNVVNNFVSYDFPLDDNDLGSVFHIAGNSQADIQLLFREEYLSGTTFTAPTGTTSSNVFQYINASLPFVTAQQIDWNGYVMDDIQFGKFLQTKQDMQTVPVSDGTTPFYAYPDLRQWLSFFTLVAAVKGLKVVTRDEDLNVINTYFISNQYQLGPDRVQIVGTGIPELSGTVDFTDVAYYDVSLVAVTTTNTISQIVRYKVLENCGRFATGSYKLYWLGSFGEFNSWFFTKKNETTLNKTQTIYKKVQGSVNSNGSYTQNTYSPSDVPFYTAVQDSTVLSTNFLSDSDVLFLKGAFTSPVVFLEDNNGVITSVTINQNSYVINKTVNKRPYALQLTVQSSVTDFGQQL